MTQSADLLPRDTYILFTFIFLYNRPDDDLYKKTVPLQTWTGPEGSRTLRFPDFVATAQDGGKVVSLTHRPPLPLGNIPVLISVRG
jgi:hypothetical protein